MFSSALRSSIAASVPTCAHHCSSAAVRSDFQRLATSAPRSVSWMVAWPRPRSNCWSHPDLMAVAILVLTARLDKRTNVGISRTSVPCVLIARRRFAQRSRDGIPGRPAPCTVYACSKPLRTFQSKDGSAGSADMNSNGKAQLRAIRLSRHVGTEDQLKQTAAKSFTRTELSADTDTM